MTDTLLDLDAVAELLGVSTRTVLRLPIPYAKIGRCRRYRLADVDAYVAERMVAA